MEKEQIKALMEGNLLRAYLYSEDRIQMVVFENTPANIANFLAGHQYDFSEIILTDMVDQAIAVSFGIQNEDPKMETEFCYAMA